MRICLVGHSAGGFTDMVPGGSEKQIALLGVHLARRGHQVDCVVATNESVDEGCVNGVRIIPAWEPHRGIRGIRLLTYRLPMFRKVLEEVDADAYYMRGLSYVTPSVVAVAHVLKSKSLVALTNDNDLESAAGKAFFSVGNEFTSSLVAPIIHRCLLSIVLPKATRILVQNQQQARSCESLHLAYRLIPSIVEVPANPGVFRPEDIDVVWVGNVSDYFHRSKGLDHVSELAYLLPDAKFVVVGEFASPHVQPSVTRLRRCANAKLTGRLSNAETLNVIARSKIVINTSPSEGFSNAMLEAWSYGKPTVTLNANPDRLLTRGGLGFCANGNIGLMAEELRSFLANEAERRAVGDLCERYVRAEHSPEKVCDLFECVIRSE